MSTTRFANTYQTVNLFRNGGFDFASGEGKVPEFWGLVNATEASDPNAVDSNTYQLITAEAGTVEEPVRDYLRVDLVKTTSMSMTQTFLSDEAINTLDFTVPLLPKSRLSLPQGYVSTENLLLPAGTPLTLALDARVIRGSAKISIKLYDLNLNEIETGNNLLIHPNEFSPWEGTAEVFRNSDQGPFGDNGADIVQDGDINDLQFRYLDIPATALTPGVYAFGMYLARGADPVNGGNTVQSVITLNETTPLRQAIGTINWVTTPPTLTVKTKDSSDSFVEGSMVLASNNYYLTEIRKNIAGMFGVRCEIQPGSNMSGAGTGNVGAYGAYLRNVSDLIDTFEPISLKADGKWKRYSETFSTSFGIGKIEIIISKESGGELTEVHIGKLSLAEGKYGSLPYTGDLMSRCIPEGAIILMMGASCPPGFEELGEGDNTPLSLWTSEDPAILARKGNYPRNSVSGELEGSVSHNAEDVSLTPGKTDVDEFEGYDSKIAAFFDGTTQDNNLIDSTRPNPPMDLADSADGVPTHNHTLETAEHRPVSRGFRFCKRL
jgi:hypothetical protein